MSFHRSRRKTFRHELSLEENKELGSKTTSKRIEEPKRKTNYESFKRATIEQVHSKKIAFDLNKWQALEQQADLKGVEVVKESKRNSLAVGKSDYTFASWMGTKNQKVLRINTDLQVELDEELAKQLQEEEYNIYRTRHR